MKARRLIIWTLVLGLSLGLTSTPSFAKAGGDSPLSGIWSYLTASKNKVVVEEVEYDRDDRVVEFEFRGSVKWKSPKVKITRGGKNYAKKILSKDSDELEVKVKKLKYGAIYSYKITGVKNKKGTKYRTVTGTFRAVD